MSYIDSSRGTGARHGGKDVQHRRPRHRLRHGGECDLWLDVLDLQNGNGRLITAPTKRYTISFHIVGADIIRPQKGTVFTVPFLVDISMGYSQYIPKSRYSPADFVFRDHRKISANWVCLLGGKPIVSWNQLSLTPFQKIFSLFAVQTVIKYAPQVE